MAVFFITVNIIASIFIFIAALVSEHVLVENNFKNVVRLIVCLFLSWFSPYLIIDVVEGFPYRESFLRSNVFFVLGASFIAFVCWQLVFYDIFGDIDEGYELD